MFNAKSLLDALISAGSQAGAQAGQQGGLGGVLGGLADQVQRSGGLGGLAGQILTQATQGVGDAARQTGVQQGAGDALGRVTGGRTPDQLIEQAKGMFNNNPALATAVLGGLGALVFGTSTGRAVAGSAAKLGGLALIGGLAYKAYQNYQAGKPLLNAGQHQDVLPAPAGTGFEPQAATEATALVFIRAMIAAAAAAIPVSSWLLAFAMFLFLSLALVKRYTELRLTQDQSGLKKAGRGYHAEDIEALSQLGMASGCTCALIMALYVDSANVKQLYSQPKLIWLICPIVLYQMARIWFMARRGNMPDDPLIFMIRDWRSLFMGLVVVLIMVAATFVP